MDYNFKKRALRFGHQTDNLIVFSEVYAYASNCTPDALPDDCKPICDKCPWF